MSKCEGDSTVFVLSLTMEEAMAKKTKKKPKKKAK